VPTSQLSASLTRIQSARTISATPPEHWLDEHLAELDMPCAAGGVPSSHET
jgi:hypothetical protein